MLINEETINEHVDILKNEFLDRNVDISLEETQNILCKILKFSNWDELLIANKEDEKRHKFLMSFNNLLNDKKESAIRNAILNEDFDTLNFFIYYKFEHNLYQEVYFRIDNFLLQINNKSAQFQLNVFNVIKKYIKIENQSDFNTLQNIFELNIALDTIVGFLKDCSLTKDFLQNALVINCERNKVDIVKYLLTYYAEVDIDDVFLFSDNSIVLNPLCCAVRFNCMETIKFLLTSNDISQKANININQGEPLIIACSKGHLPVVQYLLTNKELKEHSDMYLQQCACLIAAFEKNHMAIVNFLLYDMKLIVNPHFYQCISNLERFRFFDDKMKSSLTQIIEKRNLYFNLNNKLIPKSTEQIHIYKI